MRVRNQSYIGVWILSTGLIGIIYGLSIFDTPAFAFVPEYIHNSIGLTSLILGAILVYIGFVLIFRR